MTQNIRDWIDDERAVSPVIGVILMVAITVILAAVIGTFVLDLGQSAGQTAPQASLSVTASTSTNNVTVEHTGGDAIDAAETRVIIEGNGSSVQLDPASSSSTLSVGGSVDFSTNSTVAANGPFSGLNSASSSSPFNFSSGDQITITIIDTSSQRQIFETTVTA